MRVLVTGATGFVGSQLLQQFVHNTAFQLRAAVRSSAKTLAENISVYRVGDLSVDCDWREALDKCQVVIHTAARAHIMNDSAQDPLTEFRRVNVDGTLNLARQAIEAGVKRFIFISSIKVNGEGSPDRAYRHDDIAAPEDAYGQSKWEAEQGLRDLCVNAEMELVVIRPPLIYGPGVKGNLALLAKAIDKGLPLPLGAIKNQRDMLSLNNLIDLIGTCVDHPAAAGQVFLCCDNEPISTPQLITLIAKGRQKDPRLWSVPQFLLSMLARISGRQAMYKRLSGDFRVDIQHTMHTLDWKPPFSVAESMRLAFAKST